MKIHEYSVAMLTTNGSIKLLQLFQKKLGKVNHQQDKFQQVFELHRWILKER